MNVNILNTGIIVIIVKADETFIIVKSIKLTCKLIITLFFNIFITSCFVLKNENSAI